MQNFLISKNSLALRLLKVVFSIYLCITVAVTLFQLISEYQTENNYVKDSLIISQSIFQESLTRSAWDVEERQLKNIAEGILKQSTVTGIQIAGEESIFEKGQVLNRNKEAVFVENGKEAPLPSYLKLFSHSFELIEHGKPFATVTLYSSSSVILEKVKSSFIIIIINAFIKTIALWSLFIWAFNKFLTKQLDIFCQAMENVDIDNQRSTFLHLDTLNTYELSRIEFFFNDLLKRIIESRDKLNDLNKTLEEKVKERTRELNMTLQILKKDLNFSSKIQKKLLPADHIHIANINITSFYKPMEEVGGDFYDISQPEDDIIRILIADATGHGVQAALITMLIKSEYEALKNVVSSPAHLLQMMNNLFYSKYSILDTLFSCFVVDINLSENSLCYASAGHPSQILVTKDGLIELGKTGKIIGIMKNANYEEVKFEFHNYNKLFLFTDGIFEESNIHEEEFGEDKIREIVLENKSLQSKLIIEKILESLEKFLSNSEIQDDITVIGVEGS